MTPPEPTFATAQTATFRVFAADQRYFAKNAWLPFQSNYTDFIMPDHPNPGVNPLLLEPIVASPALLAGPPLTPRGKASDYMTQAARVIAPGDKVILCCRVSKHTQRRRGNLKDQERGLRKEAEALGAEVIDVVHHEGSGWVGGWLLELRPRAIQRGAMLLAETPSRFVRHLDYHSKRRPKAQATEDDLRCLAAWTRGLSLLTVVDPDLSPEEERSFQTKRGQEAKGKKGGRPVKAKPGDKKQRRAELLPRVLELHQHGMSVREIVAETGVAKSTVHEWLRNREGVSRE